MVGTTSGMRPVRRGLVAGAAGTLLLNATTYVDMALTGRDVDNGPGEAVRRTARRVGLRAPGDDPRLQAYGELGGMAVGLGLGAVAGLLSSAGFRPRTPVGTLALGGLALAASDASLLATGVTHPRDWRTADVVRQVVPHLAYGLGTCWALAAMSERQPHPQGLGRGSGRDRVVRSGGHHAVRRVRDRITGPVGEAP